jgi:hypothetical protein
MREAQHAIQDLRVNIDVLGRGSKYNINIQSLSIPDFRIPDLRLYDLRDLIWDEG